MNREDLHELQSLREEQRRLRESLQRMEIRLAAFEHTITTSPLPEPPPLPGPSAFKSDTLPLPLPPAPAIPPRPQPAPLPPPPLPKLPRESFELQLGAVWLARLGILMLLTGLVFLGNYAWQTYGSHLGPPGRVTLLCAAAAALTGAGYRMQRRPSLQLYAQVLMGGGAALAYYTTYAAHYVARLQVIESPLLGGALLLACGLGLLAVADWRRWELAALLTVVLSYYTAGINPIGEFTLFSNLLLTAAGLVLLLRRHWTGVSWATLLGTYGSYAFWHYCRHAAGGGLRAHEPWLTGLLFLTCYWSFFTAALFLVRSEVFPASRRVSFLTLNNGAFLLFALSHLLAERPEALWPFCLLAGGVLLALSAVAWRWRREELALDGAYLLQGVALVTMGLAQKLGGPSLALALAVESLVLLTGAGGRHGWLYQLMASAIAGWALGVGGLEIWERSETVSGAALALLLLADAWWLKQRRGQLSALRFDFRAAWFSALGLGAAALVLEEAASPAWLPISCALAAVVCTASVYLVRLPEVVFEGQLFLAGAIGLCLLDPRPDQPWWFIWPVAAGALGLAHWWQRQRILRIAEPGSRLLQTLSAFVLTIFLFGWMQQHLSGDLWLAAISAAAIGTLLYGWVTRAWALVLCGQFFALAALLYFAQSLTDQSARWPAGLAPAAALLLGYALLPLALQRSRESLPLVIAYWWAGLSLVAVWAFRYLPARWQPLFFAGVFLLLLLLAGWRKHTPSALGAAAFALLAYLAFGLDFDRAPDLRSLVAIVAIPVAARAALRFSGGTSAESRRAVSLVSGLAAASLWLWVTRWCHGHGYGRSLTVAWSATALLVLGAGLAVRERVYRVSGFFILALAVGRIFTVDVWQLETLYRILSFLSLGAVLLLLGYLYSRYSEQIRKWL